MNSPSPFCFHPGPSPTSHSVHQEQQIVLQLLEHSLLCFVFTWHSAFYSINIGGPWVPTKSFVKYCSFSKQGQKVSSLGKAPRSCYVQDIQFCIVNTCLQVWVSLIPSSDALRPRLTTMSQLQAWHRFTDRSN